MDFLKKHPMTWFWLSLCFAFYAALVTFQPFRMFDFLYYLSFNQRLNTVILVFSMFFISIISFIKNKSIFIKVISSFLTAYYFLACIIGISNVD